MNENNNFGLKDVIEYYEKQGYIFYNLSNIKTLKNYIDFEKYKRINKNKLITYIECSSSYNKETTKFNKRFINILLKLFNYKNNHKYGKNAIIFFLEIIAYNYLYNHMQVYVQLIPIQQY